MYECNTRVVLIDNVFDTISFGKYKGWTINRILRNDAHYLLWAHKNTLHFTLSDTILKITIETASTQTNKIDARIQF